MGRNSQGLIGIVGGGPSGIASAVQLKKRGYNNFIILDERERFGGLWAGAGSPVYQGMRTVTSLQTMRFFGHYPKTIPGSEFCSAEAVSEVLDGVVSEYDLGMHFKPNSRVDALSHDPAYGWQADTTSGIKYGFDRVVLATGSQQRAYLPPGWRTHPSVSHSSRISPAHLAQFQAPVVVGCGTSAASLISDSMRQGMQYPVVLAVPPEGRWVVPTLLEGRPTDVPVAQSDDNYLRMGFEQFIVNMEASLSTFMYDRLPGWRKPNHAPFEKAMLISHDIDQCLTLEQVVPASGDALRAALEQADLIVMATGFEDTNLPLLPRRVRREMLRLLPPRLTCDGSIGWLRVPETDLGGLLLIEELSSHLVDAMLHDPPRELGVNPSLHPSGASDGRPFVFGAQLLRSMRMAVMSS